MFRRLFKRIRNLTLYKKIILLNILLLFFAAAVIGLYLFDYYPVVVLKEAVFN